MSEKCPCYRYHNGNGRCKACEKEILGKYFEDVKYGHLANLEDIRAFILGDKNNQPK